jgi:hypothetical protein
MNPVQREILLCIPGPWKDRGDFVRAVISETKGEFMFTGMILANPGKKPHVPLDFAPHDPHMRQAFELAGQRKLPPNRKCLPRRYDESASKSVSKSLPFRA